MSTSVPRSGAPGAAFCIALAALLMGCASVPEKRHAAVAPFSGAAPGASLPTGWQPWTLSRFKRDTQYRLVQDADGATVLEAISDQAASGLIKHLDVDAGATPWLSWRWKVPSLIEGADNRQRHLEDSPARVVIAFEGDHAKLDFEERAFAERMKALTGRELPYATLMYIWENQAPVEEVIENAHSGRIRMLVAESGASRCGKWLHFSRNVAEDFRRIYGEEPGRILSIGVMTDTDNTGARARAYYGDIRFSALPPTNPMR